MPWFRNLTQRNREIWSFVILAVLIWPVIAVGLVASWGFVVWVYYALTGPPGPGPTA